MELRAPSQFMQNLKFEFFHCLRGQERHFIDTFPVHSPVIIVRTVSLFRFSYYGIIILLRTF